MKTMGKEFRNEQKFQILNVDEMLLTKGGDTPPSEDTTDPFKIKKVKYDELGNKIKKDTATLGS